jgi:uncharacterized integral membrane protein
MHGIHGIKIFILLLVFICENVGITELQSEKKNGY